MHLHQAERLFDSSCVSLLGLRKRLSARRVRDRRSHTHAEKNEVSPFRWHDEAHRDRDGAARDDGLAREHTFDSVEQLPPGRLVHGRIDRRCIVRTCSADG